LKLPQTDYARLHPLSEVAAIEFISSLTLLQSIVSILLELLDAVILVSPDATSEAFTGDDSRVLETARGCGFALIYGFTGILLPFYRELEYRTNAADEATRSQGAHARLLLLRNQIHEMALQGARDIAKGLGYVPPFAHQTPTLWRFLSAWADFCIEEADFYAAASPELLQILEAYVQALPAV
jgi:hypothetical protein